jgi:HD superfamily phosphohydrolase
VPQVKNKRKIINDPVHGFVTIPSDFIFDLIEHPFLQRLRRIKQLGLTHYVYPGATHTRFQHTIGALHLMTLAIDSLKSKGILITEEEQEAVLIAILLHDIGHGPFSHALEQTIIPGISHEQLSDILMRRLNQEFASRLDLAIAVYNNNYIKKFLHQLVTSQLDMDRLDYIKRDSFFTGVTEGTIGTDRIIKMLNVHNDNLVVEKKGIYSVEKFLISRRLMYWQVYFHKTVIASENLLVRMLQRAKYLASCNKSIYSTPALSYFLDQSFDDITAQGNTDALIEHFNKLDDTDIVVSAKEWQHHEDPILSMLSRNLLNRILPAVTITDQPVPEKTVQKIRIAVSQHYKIQASDLYYLVSAGEISNNAYTSKVDMIQILMSRNEVRKFSEVSDILNDLYMERSEKKYFLCFPKEFGV